jgi:uncharacterized damage-inducible protein DinB
MEMANTRKTLERVPDDKLGWKPHEKSMTMGRLAGHLAGLPGWASETIANDTLDIAPVGKPAMQAMTAKSRQETLDQFDKHVKAARAAIAGASDDQLMKPWSLLKGGQTLMTMPKIAVLRGFVMNHAIHHRAQLGVYLRLNNIAVPSIYGPSADEGQM